MRCRSLFAGILFVAAPALADELTVLGAEKVAVIDPDSGYVGDPYGFDAAGRRLVWLQLGTDQISAKTYDLTQKATIRSVDLPDAPWTDVAFAVDGEHVFATERGDKARGYLVGPAGKGRSFGPAEDVLLLSDESSDVVLIHTTKPRVGGGAKHFFETRDAKSGAKRRRGQIEIDARGFAAALDFQVHGFTDNYTRALGEKGGAWDPEENQRTPNLHSVYDILKGTFVENSDIGDLVEYRKTMLPRQEIENLTSFVHVENGTKLYLVSGAKRVPVELEEPLSHYDVRTLANQPLPDGTIMFSIRIEPVHPDAARAKRAETAWTDIYVLEAGANKAVRKARFVDSGKRRLRWQATREFLAILPGHRGFDRGGEALYIYALR